LATIKTSVIIKFIESFPHKKKPPSTHGPIVYDIYSKNGYKLNLRPILVMNTDKEYGDAGLKFIANTMGIRLQFLKQLLNGEKTTEDYENEITRKH